MIKYLVIHNKHEGCYDFKCYQDEQAKIRLTSITINPPKIFMFSSRDEAQDFFEEYINDVDCLDIRCKKGEDVEHLDYCTCGVIELDEAGEPILFYNKKNQIFLMENAPQLFLPNHELKTDIKNMNLTNHLIRKCKRLDREQRKQYIELGKFCEECNNEETAAKTTATDTAIATATYTSTDTSTNTVTVSVSETSATTSDETVTVATSSNDCAKKVSKERKPREPKKKNA